MAAAAGAGGGATAATATTTSNRFVAACGALSQYVKAAETARASRAPPVVRPLPLMPGADVNDAASEGQEDVGPAPAQMTIVYGGRVLVVDDVPADKAAGLMHVAAAVADMPVARKASLQRFMEKRRGRVAARSAPYLRPGASADCHNELTLALAL